MIVIRSLVPGGVAERDGGLLPGDRLMYVNSTNLESASLEDAVQALKGAKLGRVQIGVAKPLPVCPSDRRPPPSFPAFDPVPTLKAERDSCYGIRGYLSWLLGYKYCFNKSKICESMRRDSVSNHESSLRPDSHPGSSHTHRGGGGGGGGLGRIESAVGLPGETFGAGEVSVSIAALLQEQECTPEAFGWGD